MDTLKILAALLLLPTYEPAAQTRPARSQDKPTVKRPAKRRHVAASTLEDLQVGDTCYVTSTALHLRGDSSTKYRPHMAFEHGKDLIVREVTNNEWILIESYSEDVSIMGYVRRKYISKVKPKK